MHIITLNQREKISLFFYCGVYDQYKINLTLRLQELVLSEGWKMVLTLTIASNFKKKKSLYAFLLVFVHCVKA